MRGFGAFLGKEFSELLGSWKAWVLPLVIASFGLLSPVIARLQPQFGMPVGTTVDAYLHFSSNLIQVVLMGVIIAVAGTVSRERRSGTAILMLTKPLSRASFVFAKIATKVTLVIVSGAVGALACRAMVQVIFDGSLGMEFAGAVALWMVLATMVVCLMTLLSVLLDSQAGAAGGGFAIYLILALFTQWEPALEYSPVGLMNLGGQLLAGQSVSVIWPVVTALLVALIASGAAAATFRRQEI